MSDWFKPSKPEDIKPIPWLGKKVIDYLESILTPEMDVLEHGSGGSTLWFAERVKSVIAVELEDDWCRIVSKNLKGNNAIVKSIAEIKNLDHSADLLLIDGNPVEDRAKWILVAHSIVKPGGWIVLDNANRPEYAKEREQLAKVAKLIKRFDCNNGTQYLITEFYRCE